MVIPYVGCSNFSGWHLMKSLAVTDRYGWPRHVAHQAYYSLLDREYEWELMPLALDQRVGIVVRSPLAGGRLTGKVRRENPLPEASRVRALAEIGSQEEVNERLFAILEVMDDLAAETDKSHAQVTLNWLLRRPTVSTVIFGARNEEQLRANLGAAGWNLTGDQFARLDAASAVKPIYPYWLQRATSPERNPPPV